MTFCRRAIDVEHCTRLSEATAMGPPRIGYSYHSPGVSRDFVAELSCPHRVRFRIGRPGRREFNHDPPATSIYMRLHRLLSQQMAILGAARADTGGVRR